MAEELAGFVEEASERYGFDPGKLFAVGCSNGANIAASLALSRPDLLRGAVLLRPMVPFEPEALPDLSGVRIFVGAGELDQMVPRENTERLVELLRDSGRRSRSGGSGAGTIWPEKMSRRPGGGSLRRCMTKLPVSGERGPWTGWR